MRLTGSLYFKIIIFFSNQKKEFDLLLSLLSFSDVFSGGHEYRPLWFVTSQIFDQFMTEFNHLPNVSRTVLDFEETI